MGSPADRDDGILDRFHPAVSSWFRERFGGPTPAQQLGWPAIASGQHTLIVAPTGSGKTLAAFLAALDHIWRTPRSSEPKANAKSKSKSVRILYVSPLKALNQDVWQNLQFPLGGILARSEAIGLPLPALRVAVRSGDTPAHERAAIVRKPPDILITTPESLHLMLTSRAREILRGISHVIIDEIHAVCGNKRGAFLALLLERLQAIADKPFTRIGLSATQRPLDEVARYLGGLEWTGAESSALRSPVPRPVTIIDAGWRRDLDLQVIWPRKLDRTSVSGPIWPDIERELLSLVCEHRSTIIFANNRRTVEKLTARLNELAEGGVGRSAPSAVSALGAGLPTPPGKRQALGAGLPTPPDKRQALGAGLPTPPDCPTEGLPAHQALGAGLPTPPGSPTEGLLASKHAPDDDPAPFRAHHGSISLDERRATEEALKKGELQAVVATASLELGIDMGAVDLVCQVESPGNVARGLQRVGRAGHVVRGVSKGRLIAKTPADLLEAAALCRSMIAGDIEHLRVPMSCLDVLAQQVIACVAMEPWDVPALYDLVRRAYPFHALSAESFESVLRLISGRFPTSDFRDLRARVVWDRVHNRLAALPGTAQLALVGGGTIPDTGQFPVYLGEGGPRLGELDEEFVYERRVGESFVLGNSTWRLTAIEPHRVVVAKAEGHSAVMPFWRGENAGRSPELGAAVGALSREVVDRLGDPELPSWLEKECRLTGAASALLRSFILRQHRLAGAVPSDRTIVVETFVDPTGELGLAVLTPFGGRLHHALKLALVGRIRERFGLSPACLHGDDGLLFRLPAMAEPPLDLLDGLTGDLAERLVRAELPETALFGLRFRQNAARALLMPRPDPAKRTPLWLQRLRAKDLLQIARQFPDFPILLETVRECLDDDLDLPRLRSLLDAIADGAVRVVRRAGEVASPFTSELIFQFTAAHLYEWDDPKRSDRSPAASIVDEDLLAPLLRGDGLADWLSPQAIGRVENRLRRFGHPPRTADEMAEHLRLLGDLTPSELAGPMEAFLTELHGAGRALLIELPGTREPTRWILAEERSLYDSAFAVASHPDAESRATIARRFLRTHALIGLADLTARYPISPVLAAELLERWAEEGRVVRVSDPDAPSLERWAERENLAEMRRVTVAVRRRESLAVAPEVFADFLLRRQHVHPATVGQGAAFVEVVLEQLQGFATTAASWEKEVLPRRVKGYRPAWLDDVLGQGAWLWRAMGTPRDDPRVAFFLREFEGRPAPDTSLIELSSDEQTLIDLLTQQGASFATDLARRAVIEPSRVRRALAELMNRGLVTNDRFDPLRAGSQEALRVLTEASSSRRAGQSYRIRPRRSLSVTPEGRWSRLDAAGSDAESSMLAWISVLIERYGVLTREMAALEPSAPSWAELAPLLSRSEWRGELRRGYFVEGLSGVQYASAEAGAELARLAATSATAEPDPLVLVCTTDPANLYGAGAPLDVELLDGGVARLPRLPGNFLVLRAGRPILIIESHGKRLTGLASAAPADIDSALNLLLSFTGPDRRILKVESYNKAPASEGPVAGQLAELGFVRDYPGMAYYSV